MPAKNQMTAAYSEAQARLRKRHDSEFHEILEQVYEERGMTVRKRQSHAQAKARRMEEARALLASQESAS